MKLNYFVRRMCMSSFSFFSYPATASTFFSSSLSLFQETQKEKCLFSILSEATDCNRAKRRGFSEEDYTAKCFVSLSICFRHGRVDMIKVKSYINLESSYFCNPRINSNVWSYRDDSSDSFNEIQCCNRKLKKEKKKHKTSKNYFFSFPML